MSEDQNRKNDLLCSLYYTIRLYLRRKATLSEVRRIVREIEKLH